MSTSLSKLIDKLSEHYNKKYKDKNCKSECAFKGFKKNKLSYKCNECEKNN